MPAKASLREYQNELQAQMERARLAGASEEDLYVAFLSNGRRYLMEARYAFEAADSSTLVRIPGAKSWAAGVANIKGDAYAVTDFAVLTGGAPTGKGKFLTLSEDLVPGAALLVEKFLGLHGAEALGARRNARPDEIQPWVQGAHEIAGEPYLLVGGEQLATDPKFSNLQSGEHHDEPQG